MTRLWDFRCEAHELPDGRYRVVLTASSGKRIIREGRHPLWELIRALATHRSNVA